MAIPLFQNLCRGVSRRWPGQVVYLLTCCQDRIVKNFEQTVDEKEKDRAWKQVLSAETSAVGSEWNLNKVVFE